jgi:homoserine dehydrogenase
MFRRGRRIAGHAGRQALHKRAKESFVTQNLASPRPPASRPLKVALVGFGTVGRSVAKILCADPTGPLRLISICNRNVQKKKSGDLPAHIRWTDSFDEVLASDADVVVELIGGLEPAGTLIRRALGAGKSVVTANKLLIAESGPELIELATAAGQRIEFGASVAGGIPAIMGIEQGLAGDRLFQIQGILNGTCNYILTQMEAHGASFATALAEAQKLGFAEADPSSDIDGIDARAKLVILTQAGLHMRVRADQIPCRPISAIEAVDFAYAHDLSCTIRQISSAKKVFSAAGGPGKLFAAVQPALVPLTSLIAHVEGGRNLVASTGEFSGQMVFSGFGAGGDPTAVAVVSDLIAIASSSGAAAPRVPTAIETPAAVSGDFTVRHYLRLVINDRPGIIAALATVLSRHGISIDAVLQKPGYPHSALPFVITIEPCSTSLLAGALEEIEHMDFHVQAPLHLPIFAD